MNKLRFEVEVITGDNWLEYENIIFSESAFIKLIVDDVDVNTLMDDRKGIVVWKVDTRFNFSSRDIFFKTVQFFWAAPRPPCQGGSFIVCLGYLVYGRRHLASFCIIYRSLGGIWPPFAFSVGLSVELCLLLGIGVYVASRSRSNSGKIKIICRNILKM